jgi:hypothetical protein
VVEQLSGSTVEDSRCQNVVTGLHHRHQYGGQCPHSGSGDDTGVGSFQPSDIVGEGFVIGIAIASVDVAFLAPTGDRIELF